MTTKLSIGLIADCQYADQEQIKEQHYRQSLDKLKEAIQCFNEQEIDLVVQLGDLIDRDEKSYDDILPLFDQLKAPIVHILGNHDFITSPEFQPKVPKLLNHPEKYHSQVHTGIRLIFLNGTDISYSAYPEDSQEYQEAVAVHQELYADRLQWNGALSEQQFIWLEAELQQAQELKQQSLIFCHYPIYPSHRHNLWDDKKILELIRQYPITAWINGHQHNGAIKARKGQHFLTLKAMVESIENSFAILDLDEKGGQVRGFGRQQDYQFKWKA